MFNPTNHTATLSSVNLRAEKHGEDNVPACDLKFDSSMSGALAETLIPGLRRLLFRKPAVGEQQTLLKDDDGLTQIKFPNMAPLKFDIDLPGYTIEIVRGMGLSEPINLPGVELKRFQIAPIEGGSVAMTFTVSGHPDKSVVADLYEMLQEEVRITLEPPKAARKPKAAKADKTDAGSEGAGAGAGDGDVDGDRGQAQADSFTAAEQGAPRAPLRAFLFDSDLDAVWAGVNAADAAMSAFTETGNPYDADACRELTDAELDREFPEEGEDEKPTGNRTTLRAMLGEMTEPGILAELNGPLDAPAQTPAANDSDDVDVRPSALKRHDAQRKAS